MRITYDAVELKIYIQYCFNLRFRDLHMAGQARSTFFSTSVQNFLQTNKQLMTNTNIRLPYLEDTGIDEKKLYSPKELTERFRHYKKKNV